MDRNLDTDYKTRNYLLSSLSARRAWIEINGVLLASVSSSGSLSARRAWIEIPLSIFWICRMFVALRKESVDRNQC